MRREATPIEKDRAGEGAIVEGAERTRTQKAVELGSGFDLELVLNATHAGGSASSANSGFLLRPRVNDPGQSHRTVLRFDLQSVRLARGSSFERSVNGFLDIARLNHLGQSDRDDVLYHPNPSEMLYDSLSVVAVSQGVDLAFQRDPPVGHRGADPVGGYERVPFQRLPHCMGNVCVGSCTDSGASDLNVVGYVQRKRSGVGLRQTS